MFSFFTLVVGGVLSPDACDYSLDEGCDSEDDNEQDYDFSSDAGKLQILLSFFTRRSTMTLWCVRKGGGSR